MTALPGIRAGATDRARGDAGARGAGGAYGAAGARGGAGVAGGGIGTVGGARGGTGQVRAEPTEAPCRTDHMSEHQANQADTGGEDDPSAVISAVLTGSRLLVAIAARSLGAVEDRVTLPQFRMLVVLTSHGDTKLVTMAERLNVNPSTAMRMADRLAASRLVVREVNPKNRRETLMRLTPEGRRIVDEVTARRREEIAGIVSRMSAEQRHALISAMTAFNEAGGEPPVDDAHPLGWPDV
ncbi:hypothetical protein GCM10010140_47660 [Streptosporangium pseudovulgare]|uniref:HTH marR-type domain-containing protein n=2 Tax=Streptosporangium pseudovulgare TaxID=35765 RepID=A0ABQ2R718_9ACTN|nr:hypothetical protein GCM10010140_47660 [Streptosporangium pseudovulgare]